MKDKNVLNYVNVVILLDESGSMKHLSSDVVGGFNSLIDKLRKMDNNIRLTLKMFNNNEKTIFLNKKVTDITYLSEDDYNPMGLTSLLDAIGHTFEELDKEYNTSIPKKTLIYITTDGKENSSIDYNYSLIEKMINWHTSHENYDIEFLAADIEIKEEARKIGVQEGHYRYVDISEEKDIDVLYNSICSSIEEKIK